jgi:hypothetical protein
MPNDPKWRTIARVSKQSIPAVLSVYVHLLVIASNATERGRTQNVCSEDLASALDLDAEQVDAILAAMQGRVLDGDMVSGWAKRQVEREDGSAERSKLWREAQKEAKRTQSNAGERKQTPDKDTDTDTEQKIKTQRKKRADDFDAHGELVLLGVAETVAADFLAIRKRKRAPLTATALSDIRREADKAGVSVNSALEKCCARGWQGFEASWLQGVNSCEASYSDSAMTVIESYNAALGANGWPEAVAHPYSPDRAAAIAEFVGFNNKPDGVAAYFSWLLENLTARPGFGFDWAIKRETFLRAREGNFAALAA